ncbi:MAG: 50S rRNA methyltransferase, partial [Clostridia bacterium]|nr:50S rRNA methyltransferase [Clostridia bacterium]
NEEEVAETGSFELVARYQVDDSFTAVGDEIKDLLQMTPYYYHTPKEAIERVSAMDQVSTRLSYDIKVYKRNEA